MRTIVNLPLLRRLNLNHLVSFLAIAECQSFTAAATHLHISPPSLSVQIHQLEETLGVPLFHRTTRLVTLTTEGKHLLPVARLLAQEVTQVANDFREEAALHRGSATLSALPSLIASLVPSVLGALANAYPGVTIRLLVQETSDGVADMVREGEADIGLLNYGEDLKDLTLTKVFEDKVVAVVPASNPQLAKRRHITLRELAEFPFLMQSRGSSFRNVLERYLAEQGVTVNICHELRAAEAIVALVSQGLGVAILTAGSLATLNLTACGVIRLRGVKAMPMGLAMSSRRSVSPAAGILRKFILDASSQMPGHADRSATR